MSNGIFETDKLQFTAFVGRNGDASVQISWKGNASYEQLERSQVLELAHALLARLVGAEGYSATD